jgi:hypothetical protein
MAGVKRRVSFKKIFKECNIFPLESKLSLLLLSFCVQHGEVLNKFWHAE